MRVIQLFVLLILVLFVEIAWASDLKYPAANIPVQLKKDADIVVRDYSTFLKIESENSAVLTVHITKTILTEEGREKAYLMVPYDKTQKVKIKKAIIYNALGEEIKKIKQSEVKDYSNVSGYTLFEDDRTKFVNYSAANLPYTVEYEYEIQYDGFVGLPTWRPFYSDRQSLESAELVVDVAENYSFRYLQFNLSKPDSSLVGTTFHYKWTVGPMDAYKDEPYTPNPFEYLPTVFLGFNRFSYCNTVGDFSSWGSYGSWVNGLLVGRDVLPKITVDKVHELVEGAADKYEVIKRIYKYMQSRTRYVSIQLGIGGFQPFPAATVDETGYGDCKALANYTKALLAVAGVKAYYTEIGVDYTEISFPKFPTVSQTNHIVLAIPSEKDTLWLECTSQRNPFNYVPSTLVNRTALMITEKGGVLVNTPIRRCGDNIENKRVDISVDVNGDATFEVWTTNSGSQVENLLPEAWGSRKEQEEELYKQFSLPGLKIFDFNLAVKEGVSVTSSCYFKASAKVASKTGSRLFVPIIPVKPYSRTLAKPKLRKLDFVVESGWTDCDTIVYTIPAGYKVESMVADKSIETEFGSYKLTCSIVKGQLIFVRTMSIAENHYSAVKYNSFVDFINTASKADRSLCVIMPE